MPSTSLTLLKHRSTSSPCSITMAATRSRTDLKTSLGPSTHRRIIAKSRMMGSWRISCVSMKKLKVERPRAITQLLKIVRIRKISSAYRLNRSKRVAKSWQITQIIKFTKSKIFKSRFHRTKRPCKAWNKICLRKMGRASKTMMTSTRVCVDQPRVSILAASLLGRTHQLRGGTPIIKTPITLPMEVSQLVQWDSRVSQRLSN